MRLHLLPDLRRRAAAAVAPRRARKPRRAPDPRRARRAVALRDGIQPLGAGGRRHPAQARHARAGDRGAHSRAAPRRAVQRRLRRLPARTVIKGERYGH